MIANTQMPPPPEVVWPEGINFVDPITTLVCGALLGVLEVQSRLAVNGNQIYVQQITDYDINFIYYSFNYLKAVRRWQGKGSNKENICIFKPVTKLFGNWLWLDLQEEKRLEDQLKHLKQSSQPPTSHLIPAFPRESILRDGTLRDDSPGAPEEDSDGSCHPLYFTQQQLSATAFTSLTSGTNQQGDLALKCQKLEAELKVVQDKIQTLRKTIELNKLGLENFKKTYEKTSQLACTGLDEKIRILSEIEKGGTNPERILSPVEESIRNLWTSLDLTTINAEIQTAQSTSDSDAKKNAIRTVKDKIELKNKRFEQILQTYWKEKRAVHSPPIYTSSSTSSSP
jgi:hypothetical protein